MFSGELYRFDRLIQKLGIPVVLTQTPRTYSVATGGNAAGTPVTFPELAIVDEEMLQFDPKTYVSTTIFDVLISNKNLGTTPAVGDTLVVNSITYRLIHATPGYIGPYIASWQLKVVA